MNKLQQYRKQIDLIDEQIIKLFEKRMNVISLVSKYKANNDVAVADKNREKKMLAANLKKIKNKKYKKYYHFVLEGFLNASKNMQRDKKNS
ncbi:MAG: chorismate mutase [Mycoplasmoidaceae bacterium]|nr:chorismate mutase [Mycoplasmoidaceae bacterium]